MAADDIEDDVFASSELMIVGSRSQQDREKKTELMEEIEPRN